MHKINSENVAAVLDLCAKAEHIVITGHRSPDGDALGSTLALSHYLSAKGFQNKVILPDDYPTFLHWMKGNDEVIIFDAKPDLAGGLIANADLIFTLDYNDLSRTGSMAEALRNSKADMVMIDHHQQPSDYAKFTFSDTSSCSTAQMVYDFIEAAGDVALIDAEMGECIYCGIMTDSGSFRFPSVQAKTHRIAAQLIDNGLDHAKVHMAVYDTNLLDRLRLVGYALSEKLEVLEDLNVAIIYLSKEELDAHHYRAGDTEGLVNQALSIDGVKCAVFIREGNNKVKMSFRSKGDFDVNEFARAHFNGGGHKNAAGGAVSNATVLEVLEQFKAAISTYESQLK
ncbi:MAG: bifunctional oligoribonuclease/PAP phosphatase NrnA [Flavobacteriales bacterium]|nr:bifunctional oligoribonuclease/PAP phosphatase NrnA [Flavobacteriales bacterium]